MIETRAQEQRGAPESRKLDMGVGVGVAVGGTNRLND